MDLGRPIKQGENIEDALLKDAMELLGPMQTSSVLPNIKPIYDSTNESVSPAGGSSPPLPMKDQLNHIVQNTH